VLKLNSDRYMAVFNLPAAGLVIADPDRDSLPALHRKLVGNWRGQGMTCVSVSSKGMIHGRSDSNG
jgi:hypothetical protein